MHRGTLRLLMALLVVGAFIGPDAWADRSFSERELRALGLGRLVARPMRQARSSQVGGTSWILVNADVDTVWRALTDFPAYSRFVPHAGQSRIVQRNGQVRIVSIEQGQGLIEVNYALRAVVDPAKKEIRFRIDHRRPHDVRDGWGFFHLDPRDGNRTLVSYGVVVEPGGALLAQLVGDALRDHALSIPRRLKRWVEGPGRPRYARPPGHRLAGGPSTASPDRHP